MTSLADALGATGMIPPVSGADLQKQDTPGADPSPPVKTDKPKSEMDVLKEGQGAVEAARKERDEVKPPGFPTLEKPPQPETANDPMKGWVSAIGVLGAIGSMFTRRPMVNSMNAAAAAVQAMNAGDTAEFNRKFDIWKTENDNAFKILDYQTKIYDDILKSKNRSVDERMADLGAQAAAFKDDYMLKLSQERNSIEAADHVLKVQEAGQKAQDMALKIEEGKQKREETQELLGGLRDELVSGKINKQQYLAKLQGIMDPSVAAAQAKAEGEADKERKKNEPTVTPKTEKFGFESSETPASIKASEAVDVEDRKKERNVPIYTDRIMTSLENVKPQIDQFPTGASSGVRSYLMKGANLASFGGLFPTVATAGDLLDKNLYNVVMDYSNLVQNTGMRGSNLQLQTNIKGKPGPELMKEANRSIVNELEGNTEDVKLRLDAKNAFRNANPLGYADERAGDIYESLKSQFPLLSQKKDAQGNTLMEYNRANVEKIKKLLPEAIANPDKFKPPVAGAKLANDGNWYIPDPDRPGKYLKVEK